MENEYPQDIGWRKDGQGKIEHYYIKSEFFDGYLSLCGKATYSEPLLDYIYKPRCSVCLKKQIERTG